jgi:acetylornithine deacetylase/succinyl-diaminopimelate desuccinylase-like protein
MTMENDGAHNYEKVIGFIDEFKTISILRNLIRIPSYTGEEKAKADYVAKEMERVGLEVIETYIDFENGRRNVLGIIRGDGTGKSLMLCAHLDTHWARLEEVGGHDARIEGDRIYGIGTGDSMTPMAAMFGTVDAIKRSGISLKGDLIFLTTADEMCFKEGAYLLEENGMRADYCVMGEATNLDIGIVHTGKAEIEIKTTGKSGYEIGAYAKRMGQKVSNAILSMNTIINYLLTMEKEDPYFEKTHPLLPGKGAALNIGAIIGGSTGDGDPTRRPGKEQGQFGLAKRTPQYCYLRLNARYWPGQTAEEFYETVKKWVDKAKADDPSIEAEVDLYLSHGNDPFEISPDAEVVHTMKKSINQVLGKEPELVGNIYSTEGPFYQRCGMQFVWCSPGMMRIGTDEYVTKGELRDTTKIYTAMAINSCT